MVPEEALFWALEASDEVARPLKLRAVARVENELARIARAADVAVYDRRAHEIHVAVVVDVVAGEAEVVAADFRAATFSSYPVEDIRRWKTRKRLTNRGNAIEALCGPQERPGPLEEMLLAEGEAVLSAAGREVATAEEDRIRRADLLQLGEIAGQTRPGGSSWQSLRRSTGDIETDYLNGEIVLLGRIHGVPTPANELLQRLARERAVTHDAPGATPAAAILERLDIASKPDRRVHESG